jgi:hypothetical protein
MSNTVESSPCFSCPEGIRPLTPASPFYSLHYHFGMLLGVDDFETEQAYHRGKMMLHNAWLHREGVVWGLEVKLDAAKGEVRVTRGLALDGSGHELYLDGDACLNIGAWYEKHSEDAEIKKMVEAKEGKFDVHVVIKYKACLARQVPALLEPCDGSGQDTAYSRVQETVEILLAPGTAPEAPEPPYHRLRLLFGLAPPRKDDKGTIKADQDVLDERNRIQALPQQDQAQAWLEAFRLFAALDEMELRPAQAPEGEEWTLFPVLENESLVLADILNIALEKKDDRWIAGGWEVHNERRAAHVATRTIQELLCAQLSGVAASVPDAGGPRIKEVSSFEPGQVILKTNRKLHADSVAAAAFSISGFVEGTGWKPAKIKTATLENTGDVITLVLDPQVQGKVYRLIAFGTGPTPLLGDNLIPLAGSIADPPATSCNGKDFVFMKSGS